VKKMEAIERLDAWVLTWSGGYYEAETDYVKDTLYCSDGKLSENSFA
jgi:hypothetical protein